MIRLIKNVDAFTQMDGYSNLLNTTPGLYPWPQLVFFMSVCFFVL